MKVEPIKQWDEEACGPAVIEMASKYLDAGLSREEIIQTTNYKEEGGLYNTQLIDAISTLGLKATEYSSATWEDLSEKNTKDVVVILSWMKEGYKGHFSILDHVTDSHIYIVDPDVGEVISFEKVHFLRLWMDYDGKWYPEKNTDIQLRWMCVITHKE